MSLVKQAGALLRVNLAGIPQRIGLVCTIVVGVTCAVGVLVSMLAMGVGARREAMANVRPDRAILMSVGAQVPGLSSIPKDSFLLIRDLPGIRRNAEGQPIAVAESFITGPAFTKTHQRRLFTIAGVTSGLSDYLPELHLTSGRMFRPGLRELIANNTCVRQFQDLAVGDRRPMPGGEWLVVGNFDLGRTEGVCTVFADGDTILSTFHRTAYNEVNVMLQSSASFLALTAGLDANPSLSVRARYEAQVVQADTRQVNAILNFVSYVLGAIVALAATIGAANSLYAIIDGRRLELATLRAMGFSGASIIASILSESILLAVPGALIGAFLAWLFFNGIRANPLVGPIRAPFHLDVTLSLVYVGVGWALGIGLLAGFLPGLRAARVPVTVALRST